MIGVAVGVFAAVCLCACRRDRPEAADCLIVLGARVYPDGRISHSLERRCRVAAAACRGGLASRIIACGGRGGDEPEAEARAMKRVLCSQGVEESSILLEEHSTNTVENLRNAREIMRQRGLHSAVVVTSDYHLTRALWIARALNLDVQGLPVRGPLTPGHVFRSRVLETASWLKYFFCWLKCDARGKKEKERP